jgi:hypothetical protein
MLPTALTLSGCRNSGLGGHADIHADIDDAGRSCQHGHDPPSHADAVGPCLCPGMLIVGFPAGSGHRTALFAVTIAAEKVPNRGSEYHSRST